MRVFGSAILFRRAAALALPLAAAPAAAQEAGPAGPEQAGILLPPGFEASVFADDLGRARHVAVAPNGDVYVRLREPNQGGGIVALRDGDGDGQAEQVRYFGDAAGTGVAIRDGWLYVSSDQSVMRYRLPEDGLVPQGDPEIIATGFPEQRQHAAKAFAFDDQGNLVVNVGAPSNACQIETRTPGVSGAQPCPQLERQASLWRFDADQTGQTQMEDGERLVAGIRNVVALDRHPQTGEIFFAMHGRDQLHDLWPEHFTVEESAELPAEEFHVVAEGADYGWPYTYWDQTRGQRMVAPEYGGDGDEVATGDYREPMAAFPGHWAPNDLLFYQGEAFPEPWNDGAYIAFHGSWNRAPLPQGGYLVAFAPFENGRPSGDWRIFADGFKGAETLEDPQDAEYRPMGLAQGPDGALYVADSVQGRIWRVTWEGAATAEEPAQ